MSAILILFSPIFWWMETHGMSSTMNGLLTEQFQQKTLHSVPFIIICWVERGRKACEELLMQDVLHLTEEEKQQAIQDEQDFQHYVTGDRASVSAMRELIGFKAYELSGMEAYCVYAAAKYVSQVFYDYGEGFSQENPY